MNSLGERPAWSMSGSELLTTLDTLDAELARLQAYRLHVIGRLEEIGHANELGAHDTAQLIAFRYRLDRGQAHRDVRLARALPKYEAVTTALANHQTANDCDAPDSWILRPAQAEAIVTALERVPTTVPVDDLIVAERELVRLGRLLSPSELRKAAQKARNILDTDGPEPDELKAYRRESLTLSTAENGVKFRGYLANENAELLRSLIHAGARPHKTVDGEPDPRPRDKRQADALTTVLTIAATTTETNTYPATLASWTTTAPPTRPRSHDTPLFDIHTSVTRGTTALAEVPTAHHHGPASHPVPVIGRGNAAVGGGAVGGGAVGVVHGRAGDAVGVVSGRAGGAGGVVHGRAGGAVGVVGGRAVGSGDPGGGGRAGGGEGVGIGVTARKAGIPPADHSTWIIIGASKACPGLLQLGAGSTDPDTNGGAGTGRVGWTPEMEPRQAVTHLAQTKAPPGRTPAMPASPETTPEAGGAPATAASAEATAGSSSPSPAATPDEPITGTGRPPTATPSGDVKAGAGKALTTEATAEPTTEASKATAAVGPGGWVPGFGAKANITVTIDFNDLKSATPDATGDLVYGDDLSAATIRRLACDAKIIPLVLGTNSEPLDIGRAERLVNRAMRRALNTRDQGCVVCKAPPIQCDAHHLKHWINGGPTAIHNLVLLCRRHHIDLHSGHWTITITNGKVHVSRPTWADSPPRPQPDTPVRRTP